MRAPARRAATARAPDSTLRQLAAHVSDAVVSMDADGRVIGWNPHAEALFGWEAGEAIGRPLAELIIPERYRRAHAAGIRRYLATGDGPVVDARTDVKALHRDGHEFPVELSVTVLHDAEGLTFVGFVRDLSAQRAVEAELELEIAERAAIGEALRRLPPGRPAEETAAAICRELVRLPHLDMASVVEFAHDGSVIPLGQIVPPGVPSVVGRPLPAERGDYLRESATGPWIDDWRPQPNDDAYRRAWLDTGLTCAAYVPFGTDDMTYGLLIAGTTAHIGSAGVSRWLPSMTEFGAVAAALLIPELGARHEEAGTRAALVRIIEEGTLTTFFQPIVRLGDRSVVGYEALTRFADGTPPDRHFALAEAVGIGPALEEAAVATAVAEARRLPKGPWLSLNLTPSRLIEPRLPSLLSGARGRPLVIEITERLAIDDYGAIRAALERMPGSVEVAVDDAGAGFASLRHIIELRPRYVKLDMQLVRGVEGDPARQALIAGMVYFARQSGCMLVAEGIETSSEREALHRLGVPFGQGFLLGRPAPAGAYAAGRARARPRQLARASAAAGG